MAVMMKPLSSSNNQIKITNEDLENNRVFYMVVINLAGLNQKVSTLRVNKEYDLWGDMTGEICFEPDERWIGWNIDDGRCEFITPIKFEATQILNTLTLYRKFTISHL